MCRMSLFCNTISIQGVYISSMGSKLKNIRKCVVKDFLPKITCISFFFTSLNKNNLLISYIFQCLKVSPFLKE